MDPPANRIWNDMHNLTTPHNVDWMRLLTLVSFARNPVTVSCDLATASFLPSSGIVEQDLIPVVPVNQKFRATLWSELLTILSHADIFAQ